jgi:hypothetical protein
MHNIIHWVSRKSIVIVLIMTIIPTIAMYGTTPLSFAKSKASSSNQLLLPLQHVPAGTADLQWSQITQTLVVTMTVKGLAPNSTHLATIQQGPDNSFANCNRPIRGKIIYNLNMLKADKFGNANAVSTTIAHVPTGIPDGGWYLAVLNGSQLSTNPQQTRIACGEIVSGGIPHGVAPLIDVSPTNNKDNPSPTNTPTTKDQLVHVYLAGSADANQLVVGGAELSLNNKALTVIFSLGGLTPNSKYAAQIHSGTCEAQGPVVFPLNDINVDKNGDSPSKTTIQPVPTSSLSKLPWYITVYEVLPNRGSNSQIDSDPIACGNFSMITSEPELPHFLGETPSFAPSLVTTSPPSLPRR